MKIWTEIKISKTSLGTFMVYTVTKNSKTKKEISCLQGVYKTRAKINKCVSECLTLLVSEEK